MGDTHGFCVAQGIPPPPSANFQDPKNTKAEYGPKIVELTKRLTGAKEGFLYQYVNRGPDGNKRNFGIREYGNFAHSDFGSTSPATFQGVLMKQFKMSQEEVDASEILCLNIWHPRDGPAYKDPLCLLDATSQEYAPVKIPFLTMNLFYPTIPLAKNFMKSGAYSNESKKNVDESLVCGPTYAPQHRWFFISDQKPDEAWLFKQYDTRPNVAKTAFHTSFPDPFHAKDPNCPERKSAEFRVLLTFPKKGQSKL